MMEGNRERLTCYCTQATVPGFHAESMKIPGNQRDMTNAPYLCIEKLLNSVQCLTYRFVDFQANRLKKKTYSGYNVTVAAVSLTIL